MLLGESVGVASAAVPTSDEPQAFFVALASLASAASLWILYFGTQPKGFKRLPPPSPSLSPSLPPPPAPTPGGGGGGDSGAAGADAGDGSDGGTGGSNGGRRSALGRVCSKVFSPLYSRGAAATVAFAFFHSCYCTSLSAIASAYARMVSRQQSDE
jgi:hypothetical protein